MSTNKKQEQRQNSIESLLGAALELFVSQGYKASNLEKIAGQAKLTKGAVYFYFKSKEAVLIELLKRVENIVVENAIETIKALKNSTPKEKIIAYVHYQANLGLTHRNEVLLLILMSLEFKEKEGLAHDFISSLYKRQIEFMESLIKQGQKDKQFRSDIAPKELASMILGMNDGTFLEWFRRSDSLKGKELVKALRGLILEGILTK
jgi:AcrR family transcriptional regulator